MEIPEKAQAEALAEVARLGRERAEHLAKARALLPELRAAAVQAARIGAQRSRIQQLSQASTGTVYGWLREAGLDVRSSEKGGSSEA